MFKPGKLIIYKLGNYEATEVIGMCRFLGQSRRTLGQEQERGREIDASIIREEQ